tara:strand:+ start:94503 stop:94880 length:378 start_codon:yes stop_codon:yes gene_type:complete
MVIRSIFLSILLVTSHFLVAQINVVCHKSSDTIGVIGQQELIIEAQEFIIVYPMGKTFSTKVFALVDFGNSPKYFSSISYVSYTNEKEKIKKMTFNSEADVLNYFVKNGFEFKDAEGSFFVFQKK